MSGRVGAGPGESWCARAAPICTSAPRARPWIPEGHPGDGAVPRPAQRCRLPTPSWIWGWPTVAICTPSSCPEASAPPAHRLLRVGPVGNRVAGADAVEGAAPARSHPGGSGRGGARRSSGGRQARSSRWTAGLVAPASRPVTGTGAATGGASGAGPCRDATHLGEQVMFSGARSSRTSSPSPAATSTCGGGPGSGSGVVGRVPTVRREHPALHDNPWGRSGLRSGTVSPGVLCR